MQWEVTSGFKQQIMRWSPGSKTTISISSRRHWGATNTMTAATGTDHEGWLCLCMGAELCHYGELHQNRCQYTGATYLNHAWDRAYHLPSASPEEIPDAQGHRKASVSSCEPLALGVLTFSYILGKTWTNFSVMCHLYVTDTVLWVGL